MKPATPLLIVPVENQVRELDAKLLFACVAAERGFDVVIGSRPYVNFALPSLPPGTYVAKSMRARSRLMFNIILGLGHRLVAWDEESLVRYRSAEYCDWRFSPDTFRPLSQLFAWGDDDAELFASYTGNPGVPVHVTGNPRADLLRRDVREFFRAEVDALRDRHGEFVLVNTNFAFVNPFVDQLALVQPSARAGAPKVTRTSGGMSAGFAAGMAAHQQAIFDAFRILVPQLGTWFPDRSIIVRPHPSEDHDLWRRLAADQPNVRVVHEGNVVPWLMAASVLVHNGCTTAVEAAALERPAVAYQPITTDCYDFHLPNSLSHCANTREQVRDLVSAIVAGDAGLIDEHARQAIFARHLSALSGPLASDRITDVLERAGYLLDPPPRPGPWRYLRARATAAGRALLKRINARRREHWNSAEYHAHRFPDITAAELNARIARFAPLLGRFGRVRATELSDHLFRVARDAG